MASYNPSGTTNNVSIDRSPFSAAAGQARLWWDSSPIATRVIAVGLAVLVIICLAAAISLATAPEYQDLFTNLDPQDAAAIAAKLDDEHQKYQMTDNDTSIMVPATDKDRLRMEMVRDGLPAKTGSVVGSDWLDKIGMGTTSDVQDQYIRMANESELAQTIESMTEISSAAVHISPGSDSPFAGEATQPTASVVIGLKIGETLTSDQTMGIANLVSKAVPGLDIKNVAVVDTDGNQLWDGGEDAGPGGLASSRFVAERQYSEDIRKQMQEYLDSVLGAHKALVSVHTELNYDQIKSDQINYQKGAVLSDQETDEKYQGSSAAQTAAAGIASNTGGVPQYTQTQPNSGKNSSYEKTDGTNNYEPDKTETETEQAPGGIQKLAVAVLIDQSVPQATVASIQTYLSTLAGVTQGDASRIVTVQSVPFSNSDMLNQQAIMKSAQSATKQDEMIKIAALAAVAILLLVIFMKSTRIAASRVTGLEIEQDSNRMAIGYSRGDTDHLLDEPMSIEQVLSELPTPQSRNKTHIPEIEEHVDVKLESVRDMIKNRPQSAALLLKGWLNDEANSAA